MSKSFGVPLLTPLTDDQQTCVEMLEEALSEARQGKFSSFAVVLCLRSGYATSIAGRQAAELNLGLDDLKQQVLEATKKPRVVGGIAKVKVS